MAAGYIAINNADHFFQRLKLWCNYTNIRAKFENYQQGLVKYDGNKLTGTVPDLFSAGADINTAVRVYVNLTYSYTDKVPLNDANTFWAKSYNLFFSKVGYKIAFSKSISMDIFISYDKSFNEPYSLGNDLNAAGNRYFNSSSPENIFADVKLKYSL